MEPITLGVAGYSLFLSSFISLVVLLKRNFNQWLKSPFYILSTSDILSSIFGAIILLINYTNMTSASDLQYQNNIINISNPWNIKNVNGTSHKVAFNSFISNQETIFENNSNVTLPCKVGNIIMHYAMILIPLTNSLISLVSFCIQCNLSALHLKNKCAHLCSVHINREKHGNKNCDEKVTSDQEISDLQIMTSKAKLSNESFSVVNGNAFDMERELASDASHKDNRKFVGLFLISEWIIPIIVTGLLYFAEYRNIYDIKHMEDIQCLIENDFLNGNCYGNNRIVSSIKSTNSGLIFMPLNENYVATANLTTMSSVYNKQMDEIILKIKNIVSSAFNDSFGISSNTEFTGFNKSGLPNMAEYILVDSQMNTLKSNNIIMITKSNSPEATTKKINEIIHTSVVSTNDEHDVISNTYAGNNTDHFNLQKTLFEEPLKRSWRQINNVENDLYNNPILVDRLTEREHTEYNTAQTVSPQRYTVPMSKDEIYADTIKLIQNVNVKDKLKYLQKSDQDNKKWPKQNTIQNTNLLNNSFLIQALCPLSDGCLTEDINKKINSLMCIRDNCYVSQKFLKLYLLMFTFLIYFTCTLLSVTLQVKGRSICKISLNNINTNFIMLSATLTSSNINELEHAKTTNITVDAHESCSHSKWFPEYKKENISHIKLNTPYMEFAPAIDQADNNKEDKNNNYINLLKEAEDILKLLQILKRSFLIGMLLWTPMLFQLLLKSFMCVNTPSWLMDITLSCAMLFGIIRNILNIHMIKIYEANKNIGKGNSILPSV